MFDLFCCYLCESGVDTGVHGVSRVSRVSRVLRKGHKLNSGHEKITMLDWVSLQASTIM